MAFYNRPFDPGSRAETAFVRILGGRAGCYFKGRANVLVNTELPISGLPKPTQMPDEIDVFVTIDSRVTGLVNKRRYWIEFGEIGGNQTIRANARYAGISRTCHEWLPSEPMRKRRTHQFRVIMPLGSEL